jgi:hypothetical protein
MLLHFEHKSDRVLPWPQFLTRLMVSFGVGLGLILVSLFGGMAGYHYLESLSWMDAFLNASMILSGMGPLAQPQTSAGKFFAGMYALYSGFAVLIIVGLALAPIIHRMLHKLHVDESDLDDTAKP